ncbi:MAG: HAD family hydrolase [Spirochaetota bacterium]
MAIRGVAFDVDGTLYANRPMYILSIPLVLTRPRLLRAFRDVRIALRKRGAVEDYYRVQAEMLAEALGKTAEEARQTIERRIYRTWEHILNLVPLRRGVRRTIRELKDAGLKVAVSSDFPLERKLKVLGLEEHWDAVVPTEATGALKPNPEPFLSLSAALGLPPEEILYVGNSYAYDIVGAAGVGMKTAHISPRPVENSIADLTFRRFSDLSEWILGRTS